jgi:hypothetical protein
VAPLIARTVDPPSRTGDSEVGTYVGTSLEAMRDTTKWLVSAAAAVAASMLVGLQLSDVSNITSWASALRFTAALVAVCAALFATWIVIRAGAKVLAGSAISFADLVTLDLEAKLWALQQPPQIPPVEPFRFDELLGELHRQRKALYRETDATSPADLLERLTATYAALKSVEDSNTATFGDRTVTSADRPELRRRLATLEERIRDVLDAAALHRANATYRLFVSALPRAATILVLAIAAFALSSAIGQEQTKDVVAEPTHVLVFGHVESASLSGCDFDAGVDAVAVGGTWDAPILVIPGAGECGPARVEADEGAVVVPQTEPGTNP